MDKGEIIYFKCKKTDNVAKLELTASLSSSEYRVLIKAIKESNDFIDEQTYNAERPTYNTEKPILDFEGRYVIGKMTVRAFN